MPVIPSALRYAKRSGYGNYRVNKLSDRFYNGINLFGEHVEPDVTELQCQECGYAISGKAWWIGKLPFCSGYCRSDYKEKLK